MPQREREFVLGQLGVGLEFPEGLPRLFRLALELAQEFKPLSRGERQALLARTAGVEPIFRA